MWLALLPYPESRVSKQTKSLNWATADFRNPEELAVANRLELERLKANRDAAVKRLQKKGILDSHGRLIGKR